MTLDQKFDPTAYNGKTMFPSIFKHYQGRDPVISWVKDAEGRILEYLNDKLIGTFRIATTEEVDLSPCVTIHESKEPCPFLLPGQFIIRI